MDSVRLYIDSTDQEAVLRKAVTHLGPPEWNRCCRFLSHVFVVADSAGYHPQAKLGLFPEEMARDSVRAAVQLFELGISGWYSLVGGLDQTEAHADLTDRILCRASRKYCLGLLGRLGEMQRWSSMEREYLEREEWLANSRAKKNGLIMTRVPR